MTLNEYCKECHQIAVDHGWYDRERNPLEVAMLIVTELAEFAEEIRSGNGIAAREELADVFIRLADYCGHMHINLEEEVGLKMEKNKKRSYRHGGKKY